MFFFFTFPSYGAVMYIPTYKAVDDKTLMVIFVNIINRRGEGLTNNRLVFQQNIVKHWLFFDFNEKPPNLLIIAKRSR